MAKYEKLPCNEEGGSIESQDSSQARGGKFRFWIPWICHAILLSLSLSIFFLADVKEGRATSSITVHTAPISEFDESRIYSPAQSAVSYKAFNFNGSIDFKTVYKGTPRKELEDAWDALSPGAILPGPTLAISEEELRMIGKDDVKDATAKIPDEFGGGYFATLEVFHQLHCLNLVRMATYKEHYDLEEAFHGDVWLRQHIDHCIDMLRQRLMCTSDIGIVTADWVRSYNEPYPDFSTRHQCRDFGKIQEWAMEHKLDVSMEEMVAARGAFNLSQPPI